MKTKEELNALKKEVETLNKKLADLTDEELEQVTGGGGIENISPDAPDALKDASSTAIYGSRGANGVILVT